MRITFTVLAVILLSGALSAVVNTIPVPALRCIPSGAYTAVTFCDDTPSIYADKPGLPAIPLLSAWIELPRGEMLKSVVVTPVNVKSVSLSRPPSPTQQPTPLCVLDKAPFVDAHYKGVTPEASLYSSGWGRMGEHNLAWVALNAAQWDAETQTLLAPEAFEIEWTTAPDPGWTPRPQTHAVAQAMRALDLSTTDVRTPQGYLIVAPAVWLDTCEPLIDWRRRQGMTTYAVSIESVEASYPGDDTQERLRACIADYYQQYGVDWVTLAADSDFIPVRKLFAFNCEFGLYEDENDIPADMYYSCLDGDWNADADTLWGEDEDEPDWLPELHIGRISASSESQLAAYIGNLLNYEKGVQNHYAHALGFAMDLWPGSNSLASQQFIYDMYFPRDWDIDFLYGDANNTDNVLAALEDNPNIVQHTGHALWHLLGLEEGYIRAENFQDMPGDWGGTMYSIGCWSAALDYRSVGETGVCNDGANRLLAYVGNGRYGWGAPGAAAFGFSEFFQREFFRLLFLSNLHEVGTLNDMQKLPYTPYYAGTSVYKWCGYQLNVVGDAAARIFTDEPIPLQLNASVHLDTLFVQAMGLGALEGAVVTIGDEQQLTDHHGWARFPNAHSLSGAFSIYTPDYRTLWVDSFELEHFQLPFISEITCDLNDFGMAQGQTTALRVTLNNPSDDPINYTIGIVGPEEFETNDHEITDTLAPGGSIILTGFEATLRPVDEVGQLENGALLHLLFPVHNTATSDLLCDGYAFPRVEAPQLDITGYELAGADSLRIQVTNTGARTASDIAGVFEPDLLLITSIDSFSLDDPLAPEDSVVIVVNADIMLNAVGHFAETGVELTCSSAEQSYAFTQTFNLPISVDDSTNDFESTLEWVGDDEWRRVDTYAVSGTHCLSCRPDTTGANDILTPWRNYAPGTKIRFNYRYKMPMYGADGVYFLLEHGDQQDTLLFLGSGGALPPGERDPQVYIEGDWAEYEINVEYATATPPAVDTMVRMRLRFSVDEYVEDFNAYAAMPEVGVFIDDFTWDAPKDVSVEDVDIDVFEPGLRLWPNPVGATQHMRLKFSLSVAANCEVNVYNVRGQRVRSLHRGELAAGAHELMWDGRNAQGRLAASGVYFIRVATPKGAFTGKALLVR